MSEYAYPHNCAAFATVSLRSENGVTKCGDCVQRLITRSGKGVIEPREIPLFIGAEVTTCVDAQCLRRNENVPCGDCPLKSKCDLKDIVQQTVGHNESTILYLRDVIEPGTKVEVPRPGFNPPDVIFECRRGLKFRGVKTQQFPRGSLALRNVCWEYA